MTGTARCVYCQATGPAGHFEPIGNAAGNQACKQVNLCALRAGGHDPVDVVTHLARELAQVRRTDTAGQYGAGNPHPAGGPAWFRHAEAYRPVLSGAQLARLNLTLGAASGWLNNSGRAEWGTQLAQARAYYGCKRCGAMGPREACTTASGQERRRWHAGRTF